MVFSNHSLVYPPLWNYKIPQSILISYMLSVCIHRCGFRTTTIPLPQGVYGITPLNWKPTNIVEFFLDVTLDIALVKNNARVAAQIAVALSHKRNARQGGTIPASFTRVASSSSQDLSQSAAGKPVRQTFKSSVLVYCMLAFCLSRHLFFTMNMSEWASCPNGLITLFFLSFFKHGYKKAKQYVYV